VALVGGSLVPHGGHNPLEPARLGCPILLGPHGWNFAEIRARLVQAGGALEVSEAELLPALGALLADPGRRGRMATAASAVAEEAALAGLETQARLAPLLTRLLGAADAGA
jgi:3-deoxy-D-manno-octulosonic-acid transferase